MPNKQSNKKKIKSPILKHHQNSRFQIHPINKCEKQNSYKSLSDNNLKCFKSAC